MEANAEPLSLADEFLDDLGSDDQSAGKNDGHSHVPLGAATAMEVDGGANASVVEQNKKGLTFTQDDVASSVPGGGNKAHVEQLLQHVSEYEKEVENDTVPHEVEEVEHALVVECVEEATRLDEGIIVAHGELKKVYGRRFPELESLIVHPLDYARTVQVVAGNESGLARVALTDILPSASAIGVQLAAATTGGSKLGEEEMAKVKSLAEQMIFLDNTRQKLLHFVEKNARGMAPNLCAVIGSKVAALLIGAAGGLEYLARIPGCNVKTLGAKKGVRGIGGKIVKEHEGFVFDSDVFEQIPANLRDKLGRVLASKATLAARVDAGGCHDDASGKKWRADIEKKVEDWKERAPARTAKPLPVPDEVRKHKRGGKRKRKEREMYEMTEVRKLANRVAFGKPEETYGNDFDEGLGMLGSEGNSRLRIQVKRNTSAAKAANRKLEKIAKRRGANARDPRLKSLTSFTPVQGMEFGMVTPAPGGITVGSLDAKDGTQSNYFSSNTPFMGVETSRKSNPESK
eukprot:Plantae.Rhodophyta-Hildenbrandia_rubra.ctg11003.p1 GENE.Plantae.Rhodophyta-Hildenbrandia_rubra.ctg11003~~Plantae.Rhodophyta-Hildenbrandia_rubra.ctg11003.p1  ORF type:complete len:516 (-),score=109.06 Plantae.Rhodophyta-Hildenbrandia_rubra.ctg11003:7729-9276(-)